MALTQKFTGDVYITSGTVTDFEAIIEMQGGGPATVVLEVVGEGNSAGVFFCLDREDPVWVPAPVGTAGVVLPGAPVGFEAFSPIDCIRIQHFPNPGAFVKLQIRQK